MDINLLEKYIKLRYKNDNDIVLNCQGQYFDDPDYNLKMNIEQLFDIVVQLTKVKNNNPIAAHFRHEIANYLGLAQQLNLR